MTRYELERVGVGGRREISNSMNSGLKDTQTNGMYKTKRCYDTFYLLSPGPVNATINTSNTSAITLMNDV